jgi:hypothetical protein
MQFVEIKHHAQNTRDTPNKTNKRIAKTKAFHIKRI